MDTRTLNLATTIIGLLGGVANLLGATGTLSTSTTEIITGGAFALLAYFVQQPTNTR